MSYTYTDSDEKSSKNADRIFTDSSIMQFGERLKEAIGNESVMKIVHFRLLLSLYGQMKTVARRLTSLQRVIKRRIIPGYAAKLQR